MSATKIKPAIRPDAYRAYRRHDVPDRRGPSYSSPIRSRGGLVEKNKVIPINHLLAVQKPLADARPDVVREIYGMLSKSKKAAPPAADGIDFFPFGFEANRKPLETISQYAFEQKIIPQQLNADVVFADAKRILGF
jgi:4,5-dihydroxyphthalate decarboxylase